MSKRIHKQNFIQSGSAWHCRFLIFFFFFGAQLQGQNLGINPNHQAWQEIKTPSASFIYPKGLYGLAEQTANILHHQAHHHRPIGSRNAQIPILLHNQTLVSNGYVGLAPFRSEFFISPPQSFRQLGTTQWAKLLALHEYRHVLQNANAKVGATKVGYWLFGEVAWSGFSHFSIPNWFWEGDAVISETHFSESGRGRLPFFTLQQRTIAKANKKYPYAKIRNGSLRDLVPNHYAWGYTLLSHLENEKGSEILPNLFHDAAAYDKVIYPFSRALKKHSGFTTLTLYDSAWEASKQLWERRLANRELTSHELIKEEKRVHFYYFPQFTEADELMVWENSYQKTDQIVLIDSSKKQVIAEPGFTFDRYFHLKDSLLVWTESGINSRRSRAEYSDVVLFNRNSRQKTKLSQQARLFSPLISRDGKTVYAIEFGLDLGCQVVEIRLADQQLKVLQSFPFPLFISRLAQDKNGKLYTILQENSKVSIVRLEADKSVSRLTEPTSHSIDDIRIIEDQLYFTASFDQIDNIYQLDLSDKSKIVQLSSSQSGAYHPTFHSQKEKIYFTEGKYNGFKISALDLKGALKQQRSLIEPKDQVWQLENSKKMKPHFLTAVPDSTYEKTGYRGLLRGFRLHSWPLSASPAVQEINLEFDNYLREVSANAGGGYNLNEKASFYQAGFSYGKWFPILNFRARRSFRDFDVLEANRAILRKDAAQDEFVLGVSIPLSYLKGNYRHFFQSGINYRWLQLSDQNKKTVESYHMSDLNFNYSFLRRRAVQNLAPPWGLRTSINYGLHLSRFEEDRLQMSLRTYLPGLTSNHSLQFQLAYQKESLANPYQWLDNFSYVRGYSAPLNDEYLRFGANYRLPLLYPDWGFWGITYFKRIRANFFFDYGEGFVDVIDRKRMYKSVGSEISFDNVWFNWTELSIGVRSAYRLQDVGNEQSGEWQHGLYFSTSF
ncbi:MAG: hypothetical protein RIC95_09905 [Vicingaceae bacterium]